MAPIRETVCQSPKADQNAETLTMNPEMPPLRLDSVWERELHDRTIQELYAVSLAIEHSVHLIQEAPDQAGSDLTNAISRIDGLISDLRKRIYELSSPEGRAQTDLEGQE